MRWRGVRAGVRGIGDRARANRGQMLRYKMTERIPFLGEPTHRGERYPPVAPWHSVRDKGTNVGTHMPTDGGANDQLTNAGFAAWFGLESVSTPPTSWPRNANAGRGR